jgi:hypothetical protein
MIDGSINNNAERIQPDDIDASVAAPTVDYVARHTHTFPQVDDGPYIRVDDQPGTDRDLTFNFYEFNRDNLTGDSITGLQQAEAAALAAGHNRIVFPIGVYYIGSQWLPDKDIIAFGTGHSQCFIAPHGSWQPASHTYLMRTADDALGTFHMSQFSLDVRTADGAGGGPSTPREFDWFSFCDWRTGKNSSSKQTFFHREFQNTTFASNPTTKYTFSGNGGGKHWGFNTDGRNFGHFGARGFRISSINPLHLYGVNQEMTKAGAPDALWNMEMQGAQKVRAYSCKREGDAGSTLINDCDNIFLFGYGRQETDEGDDLHAITGSSTNIGIAISVHDRPNKAATNKGNPRENVSGGGGEHQIDFPDGLSLYKRGEPDDAEVTI